MRIDTEIRPVIVEIDGKEYNVAPKTVELLEKLRRGGRGGQGGQNAP